MPKTTKGWPPERRKKQAELICKCKPWKQSPGPTSESGKAICAQNGTKHGLRSAEIKEFHKILWEQRKTIKLINSRIQSK